MPAPAQSAAGWSFVPANPPDMRPLSSHQTPAYRAAKLFLRGANIADYLEANRYHYPTTVTADEFASMKQEGFDHVRVPIAWHQYTGPAPDFTLDAESFSRVDFVVANALKNKLAAIINLHNFDRFDRDPTNALPEFQAIWRQIAAHYQKFPPELAFELDNEPHNLATSAVMNPINAQLIGEIRKTNPRRTIFIEPAGWGGIGQLKNLVLPPDDNIIVSVHCYDPFYFTHQGASWTSGETPVTRIVFPGPPAQPLVPDPKLPLKDYYREWLTNYNTLPAGQNPCSPAAFTHKLQYLHDWSAYYGRPVHLGEFGAYNKADIQSRVNFYAALRHAAESQNIGWCIWDWSSGFRYWDKRTHAPVPGMRKALFDKD